MYVIAKCVLGWFGGGVCFFSMATSHLEKAKIKVFSNFKVLS